MFESAEHVLGLLRVPRGVTDQEDRQRWGLGLLRHVDDFLQPEALLNLIVCSGNKRETDRTGLWSMRTETPAK